MISNFNVLPWVFIRQAQSKDTGRLFESLLLSLNSFKRVGKVQGRVASKFSAR